MDKQNKYSFHTAPYKDAAARLVASKLSISERQVLIQELLAPYPLFDDAVQFIARFHHPAKPDDVIGNEDINDRDIGVPDVGQIGGFLGESRVGKSAVCTFYRSKWPSHVTEDGKIFPVAYIEATGDMTTHAMCEAIYIATGAESLPGKLKTPSMIRNSIKRLIVAKCHLVIIDDAQFMMFGRTKAELKNFLSLMKIMADSKAMNVLLVGEKKIANFIGNYAYLQGRGGFAHKMLDPLGDSTREFEMFRMLMTKVDRRMPFREESGLGSPKIAGDLYRYSDGMIGRVMNVVRYAAIRALVSDASRIMPEHLFEEVALRPKPGDNYEYFRGI